MILYYKVPSCNTCQLKFYETQVESLKLNLSEAVKIYKKNIRPKTKNNFSFIRAIKKQYNYIVIYNFYIFCH